MTKKEQRIENKKNKIKAFLQVAKANENDHQKSKRHRKGSSEVPGDEIPEMINTSLKRKADENERSRLIGDDVKKLKPESSADELKRLRAENIARRKLKMQQPLIYLTERGMDAKFLTTPPSSVNPISVFDLQNLVISSMFGNLTRFQPDWCRLLRWGKVSHTVVIAVEGMSVKDYRKHAQQMTWTRINFATIVELNDPRNFRNYITEELFSTSMALNSKKKIDLAFGDSTRDAVEKFNGFRPKENGSNDEHVTDRFPRTQLLLSAGEMLRENYPFLSLVKGPGSSDFVYTKDEYAPVTPNSPMFAIDCEMCITTAGVSELTRVSIIDEKLKLIYDALVKPDNKITNYLTQYSGITKELLNDVTTRLPDVQAHIKKILPPDAILCGQSLNSDLNALKLIHPYVIDTSVIYNLTGNRGRKSSLKLLSELFLKEKIQVGSDGHSPIEDSSSTMKLVLLKLSKGVDFGDVILYDRRLQTQEEEDNLDSSEDEKAILSKEVDKTAKKFAIIGRGNDSELSKFKRKRGFHNSVSVEVVKAADDRAVLTETRQRAANNKLTMARVNVSDNKDSELNYAALDVHLSSIYDSCAPNALIVVICGSTTNKRDSNGLCMIGLKLNVE